MFIYYRRWAPGCGPKMIAMGYNIYTQSGELNAQELLDLFFQFISWDETKAESSSFYASVDSYFDKNSELEDILEDE